MAYGATDLVIRSGLPFTRTFTYERDTVPQSWAGRVTRLQMRHPWTDDLLVELTAFLRVDADPTKLFLELPADYTAVMTQEGRWDILSSLVGSPETTFRTPSVPGRVLVLQGVTHV